MAKPMAPPFAEELVMSTKDRMAVLAGRFRDVPIRFRPFRARSMWALTQGLRPGLFHCAPSGLVLAYRKLQRCLFRS